MKKTILYIFLFSFYSHTLLSQNTLITKGEKWFYYDIDSLPYNWYKNYTVKNWKSGVTPIGYGDKKIITNINFGNNLRNKDITKYFRKTFFINDLTKCAAFELNYQRDDGIVVYINGKEVLRNNMPDIKITSSTRSLKVVETDEEAKFFTTILNPLKFKKGKNTISISVHQCSPTSSDCILNIELISYSNLQSIPSLFNENNKINNYKISEIKNQLEIEKSRLELNLLTNTNETQKLIVFILGFLLLLFLISFFLFISHQNKKESKNNLLIHNLKNDVLDKEKELIRSSTKVLHHKQQLKEIKTDLKGLKTDDKKIIDNIIRQIDFSLDKEEDWKNLQYHFDAVFEGFYEKLFKKHPSLSETELRHCMFIKMHMQTKEIARILLIDPRSVQTSRYRIKKKMELEESVDIRDYLLKIS